jgi:chromate transporter
MIIRIQSVYRIIGATIAGLAFVLPSFLIVVGLGYLYQLYGGLSWMQAVFYGVGSAVIEIIAFSAYKLTKKSIGKDWLLWSIYIVSCGVTVYTESEEILLFLTAGIIYWLVKAPPVFTKATIKSFTPISTILGIFNFDSIGSDTLEIILVLCQSRSLCFRKRTCNRSIYIYRCCKRIWMAE